MLKRTQCLFHENPLGLPRKGVTGAPQFPRRTPVVKRNIPYVKRVVAVASGKGGVGKSTVAVNLALHLALQRTPFASSSQRLRVGILDLDIFGPSIPTLMGLRNAPEPELTTGGAIVPLTNHGLPCMSMGFLLPKSPNQIGDDFDDTPVVWRGLMVQKAVQQLLFDVDWRAASGNELDVLVIDMPPGTGDVPLTLGQLVNVNGTVIVSTPQDVALSDVRRGMSMFKKVNIPIIGLLLNEATFICPSCTTAHPLFGSPDAFRRTAEKMSIDILGELPLVSEVSFAGDAGKLYGLDQQEPSHGGEMWLEGMAKVAGHVWNAVK
ncbi:P-loop containing nucleoside triphosphate hydrolase protein [Pleurotus eryngii]|uniref:P-loop containing nucleoside triphosphate hydrolase protein n=1 Tax=Pleurotus eryngii TaxID=5323 RepID=A0A9P6DBU4_PLEER|nr:P-loop containing nucleoside triphosphate hydrolase protein [Pleurotus eryngii]